MKNTRMIFVAVLLCSISSNSFGYYLDGAGHYSLQGESRTAPGFSEDRGLFQAIKQNFSLTGEVRLNDHSSFYIKFGLFDQPGAAYLGDTAEPRECLKRRTGATDSSGNPVYTTSCEDRHQNSGEPGYKSYTPKVTQAYAKYSFENCNLTAGRRARHWGTGMFLNAGNGIFDTDASIFDGFTCDVNLQKTKTLGFSVGYDKLSETGAAIDNPYDSTHAYQSTDSTQDTFDQRRNSYGAGSSTDDLDQFFVTIELNDRATTKPGDISKHIGMYVAKVTGSLSKTDLTFADLYTSFYLPRLVFRNEILFRLGKSADPNWVGYGARRSAFVSESEGGPSPVVSDVQSIGLAGGFDFLLSSIGSTVGPAEFNQGTIERHLLFFNYSHAPGDSDGYAQDYTADMQTDETQGNDTRDDKVTAMAFHKNYKPALILFNGNAETSDLRVDGIFDPSRVMNATVFDFGYRYESFKPGNFEFKFIAAQLNLSVPGAIKEYFSDKDTRPMGYAGKTLGYELDFKFDRQIGKEMNLGISIAAAKPGDAWATKKGRAPKVNYLVQSHVAFLF